MGLADQIQSGPKTAEEIAAAMGLHAPSLYRLLRALANFSIFAEQEDGRFGQTSMSDTLRSDVPYSMRGLARMTFPLLRGILFDLPIVIEGAPKFRVNRDRFPVSKWEVRKNIQ